MKKMTIPLVVLIVFVIAAGVVFLFVGSQRGVSGFDFGHAQSTLESGTPAKAKVLSIRDTGGRLNSNPSIEFQLEVQPPTGPAFVATTRAIISTVNLARFQPGASIDVKYDPADHTSVAVLP
jgi:hypothetical protein